MDASRPILILCIQAVLIIALSRAMGLLFARMRQPQVVGEMVAGIMLGPTLLGWIAPVAQQALFPKESIVQLHILSQLGVIFFLFLVGLEFDPNLVRRRGRAALIISFSSIMVPFAIGVGLTHLIYPWAFDDPARNHFRSTALFMGAAISVTAFPVLARIISERNLHKTTVGAISITGAAINDLLAWCMLAAVVAMAQLDDPDHAGNTAFGTILGAALYIGAMFFVIRPLLRRLQRVLETRGRLGPNVLAAIFLLILASSCLTEWIGIHALFGAFLMGLMMPKSSLFVRELAGKLNDFVVVFMLPIFFAYAGLNADLRQVVRPELIGGTILVVTAASVGKIGGTMFASRVCGIGWRESAALGALMNTRGLMELIILTIGLQQGLINDKVYAMMVIMALTTTAMTAPLLHWVYPAARFGGDEAAAKAAHLRAAYTVLAPVSLPQSGKGLARLSTNLVGPPDNGGKVLAMHLRRPAESEGFRSGLDEQAAEADPVLVPLLQEALGLRLPVEPISFVTRDIASDIAAVARARQADLILMGFHKPVFGQTILGGTVYRVLSEAPTDMAIFVDRGLKQPRRILVPFAGSAHDRLAIELAGRIARFAAAQIVVLHVISPTRQGPPSGVQQQVARFFSEADQPSPVEFRVVESNSPVDVVLREASDFDLIVVGMTEQWGLESHLVGLRPERLAAECRSSLLIVHRISSSAEKAAASQGIRDAAISGAAIPGTPQAIVENPLKERV